MVILNVDHPDIVEFIRCKADEEKKAWALIDAGYDGSFNGEAYASIFFQNANHSVRVTDEFMEAVEEDGEWQTHEVLTGEPFETYRARDLMREDRRGRVGLRRPGHAVRHDDQPLEPGARRRAASTRRTRAPSTCSSTTPPATSRR